MNDASGSASGSGKAPGASPAPASGPREPTRKSSETNVKETVESILVAFILAFIFRAFVVEAFVIPTGSMAPTLMGAHIRYRCGDCGYRFEINYPSSGPEGEEVAIPQRARVGSRDLAFVALCPNCGFRMPRRDPSDPDNSATAPPVHYGDRILVLKYLYLLQEPKRWDVVVFKSPSDPGVYDYTQNYIKRLVGRPNESVMILDGDIYVSSSDAELERFEVQTKPRHVQDALWRIVHHNDYHPRGRDRTQMRSINEPEIRGGEVQFDDPYEQPWKPLRNDSGWDVDERTGIFRFDNAEGAGTLFFDAEANPQKHPLTDWLAYDVGHLTAGLDTHLSRGFTPSNNVSDVKLSFFYERRAGDGPLRLELTKLDHSFIAEITPAQAALYRRIGDGETSLLQSVPLRAGTSRPMQIEFMNVDYQVTLRVNGRDILQTTRQQYQPDLRLLMRAFEHRRTLPKPQIRITAASQEAMLRHVSLWRDVYYTNESSSSPLRWGSPADFPERILTLGPDEFFVCGDNSLVSGDSRYWETPINLPQEDLFVGAGRVPRRFLLGKAFFVYWPAGFRPFQVLPPIIPNFGEMRFIH